MIKVEWKTLGEVCDIKRGTTITKEIACEGCVPVIAGGRGPAYYHNTPNRTGETVAVAGSGVYAGFVSYWAIPVFLSDSFSVQPKANLLPKFVFYFLKDKQKLLHNMKTGSGVPHVYPKDVAKLKIPLPSVEKQREIVDILDKFTTLTASLTASLTAEKELRVKQYAYYRNKLLTFDAAEEHASAADGGQVKWVELGEIGEFVRGNGLQKKDFVANGIGCIHYGQIYTHYGTSTDKTKSFVSPELAKRLKKASYGDLIIAATSENVEDVCKAVVWLGADDICISGDSYFFRHNQNPKYIAYYFQTEAFLNFKRKVTTGTKVIRVNSRDMAKLKIPLPPLAEQKRIAAILDKFDAYVNDIAQGLPAEIAARRRQYEYYRTKLLNFDNGAA